MPYARHLINVSLFKDEDYILQLDSHHRFAKNWDETLIKYHNRCKEMGHEKPILTGYIPYYDPFNDPEGRTMEPWLEEFATFYPHGTIFIRPVGIPNWEEIEDPFPSRFISGHFSFADGIWAKEIDHDPSIYFSGEELNLTVRSFTHGYDLFHIPDLVVWHATMREERDGILVWDDQHKRGEDWWIQQRFAWKKIRKLLGTEDCDIPLSGYGLGKVRTIQDYERYAGFDFKNKRVQNYTLANKFPPNPYTNEEDWEEGFAKSFYQNIRFDKSLFKLDDYEYWYFSYDDVDGNAIWVENFEEHQIREILSSKQDWVSIEKFCLVPEIPARWVLWAFSKSQGWAEKIEEDVHWDGTEQP